MYIGLNDKDISTHAPRTGSDLRRDHGNRPRRDFNPRSPHGERPTAVATVLPSKLFQPTLPARGATQPTSVYIWRYGHFNPRSPHGERPRAFFSSSTALSISTHAPRTGSDQRRLFRLRHFIISTHAPRTGSDKADHTFRYVWLHFNPRSPHGERPRRSAKVKKANSISTHAPRTGSDARCDALPIADGISTHAPRTGSDFRRFRRVLPLGISTHAPRTGSDCTAQGLHDAPQTFQPTLPARGATRSVACSACDILYFNPRSPHGERHALGEMMENYKDFNPRSPHGERLLSALIVPLSAISTHAPRTGSDNSIIDGITGSIEFQPTLPARGATLLLRQWRFRWRRFQPTLPARGATANGYLPSNVMVIFQPTLPARGATKLTSQFKWSLPISTHAPRTGSDGLACNIR